MVRSAKKNLKVWKIQVMFSRKDCTPVSTNIFRLWKQAWHAPHTERIIRKPTKKSNHRLLHIIPSIGHTWFCPETSEGVNPLNISNFHGSTNQKPGDGSMEEKLVGANHPHQMLLMCLSCNSWWLNQSIWKIWVKLDHFPKDLGEHKTYLSCHHPV